MMKKLLVLALVLAVSTIANAGFTMSPVGSNLPGVYTISISAADITAGGYLEILVKGTGVLSNFTLGAAAPAGGSQSWEVVDDAALGKGEIWSMENLVAVPVYPDGIWLTATLTGVNGDVVTAYSGDADYAFTEIGSFVVTPEPVTVALLGLGGLFIRRRKVS